MNVLADQIIRRPPLKDIHLTLSQDVSLSELKKLPRENYKSIEARGILHRKSNLVEWVNTLQSLLGPNGSLNVTVPLGATAWHDPFCVREITGETLSTFHVKSENYNLDCKPFQSLTTSILGNEFHARLTK